MGLRPMKPNMDSWAHGAHPGPMGPMGPTLFIYVFYILDVIQLICANESIGIRVRLLLKFALDGSDSLAKHAECTNNSS